MSSMPGRVRSSSASNPLCNVHSSACWSYRNTYTLPAVVRTRKYSSIRSCPAIGLRLRLFHASHRQDETGSDVRWLCRRNTHQRRFGVTLLMCRSTWLSVLHQKKLAQCLYTVHRRTLMSLRCHFALGSCHRVFKFQRKRDVGAVRISS